MPRPNGIFSLLLCPRPKFCLKHLDQAWPVVVHDLGKLGKYPISLCRFLLSICLAQLHVNDETVDRIKCAFMTKLSIVGDRWKVFPSPHRPNLVQGI
jgi:hypothetical protein